MEAGDLVEDNDSFAAPPTGAISELQDVGHEDEIEDQVSNTNGSTLSDFELKVTLKQTLYYIHAKNK